MDKLDIIIETTRIGATLRVAAMDAATGIEIIFQAPLKTSQRTLHQLAVKKMEYVLKKAEEGKNSD